MTKIPSRPTNPFDARFAELPTTRLGDALAAGWQRHADAVETAGVLAEKTRAAAAYSLWGEASLPADRPRGPGMPEHRPEGAAPKRPRNPAAGEAGYKPWQVRGAVPVGAAGGPPMKVGVLLTSHGDIDSADELEPYVRLAVLKNGALPAPDWARPLIAKIGWWLEEPELRTQYDAIGPTGYHEASLAQLAAVDRALAEAGIQGQSYVGYNFTPPLIDDALEAMKADGVTHVVVFNQGAQFSLATTGESVEEVEAYFKANKAGDWRPEVSAVRSFSDDPRFLDALVSGIRADLERTFPGAKPEEVSVLLTHHGLPLPLIAKGDTATEDMLRLVDRVRAALPGYDVRSGFLNDDFFPGVPWTQPDAVKTAQAMTEAPRPKVLLDGRVSFTVHHRATLFDANVEARRVLEGAAPGTEVRLAPNFDGSPAIGALYADLTQDALAGRGEVARVDTTPAEGRRR